MASYMDLYGSSTKISELKLNTVDFLRIVSKRTAFTSKFVQESWKIVGLA